MGWSTFRPSGPPPRGDPLAAVVATSTPVLAIAGTDDQFVRAADLDELERAGAAVERVAGTRHGFAHDPALPSHDPEAAATVWSTIVAFITETEQPVRVRGCQYR